MKTFEISKATLSKIGKTLSESTMSLLVLKDGSMVMSDEIRTTWQVFCDRFSAFSGAMCRQRDWLGFSDNFRGKDMHSGAQEHTKMLRHQLASCGKEFFKSLKVLTKNAYRMFKEKIVSGDCSGAASYFSLLVAIVEARVEILSDAKKLVRPGKGYLKSIPFGISDTMTLTRKLARKIESGFVTLEYVAEFNQLLGRVLAVSSALLAMSTGDMETVARVLSSSSLPALSPSPVPSSPESKVSASSSSPSPEPEVSSSPSPSSEPEVSPSEETGRKSCLAGHAGDHSRRHSYRVRFTDGMIEKGDMAEKGCPVTPDAPTSSHVPGGGFTSMSESKVSSLPSPEPKVSPSLLVEETGRKSCLADPVDSVDSHSCPSSYRVRFTDDMVEKECPVTPNAPTSSHAPGGGFTSISLSI